MTAMRWAMALMFGLALPAASLAQEQQMAPPAMPAATASASAPAPSSENPPAHGSRINGMIVDAQTQAPVARAHVSVAPVTNREDVRSTYADDYGAFFFDSLPAGKYSLTAEHRGYVSQAYMQHDIYSTSIAV